jgi:putative peptide zinc metalloprotease protein
MPAGRPATCQCLTREYGATRERVDRLKGFATAVAVGVRHVGARGARLVQVVAPEGVKVDAYVEEAFLPRIEAGAPARFIADEPGVPRVDCRVQSVDRIALPSVEHLALTSPYGGPIPAKLDGNGVAQPHDARFRVRLHECTGMPGTGRERTGSAVIGNSHQSFAGQWLRHVAAVQHRKGGRGGGGAARGGGGHASR